MYSPKPEREPLHIISLVPDFPYENSKYYIDSPKVTQLKINEVEIPSKIAQNPFKRSNPESNNNQVSENNINDENNNKNHENDLISPTSNNNRDLAISIHQNNDEINNMRTISLRTPHHSGSGHKQVNIVQRKSTNGTVFALTGNVDSNKEENLSFSNVVFSNQGTLRSLKVSINPKITKSLMAQKVSFYQFCF